MRAALRRDRAVIATVVAFIVLVGGMVGYNAWATGRERSTPLVVDVTARQRTLVERYVKDVVLKLDGVVADPQPSAKILRDYRGRVARRRQGREPAGEPRPVRHHPRGDRRCRPPEARARAAPDPRAPGRWVRAACGRSDEPDVRGGPAAPAGRRRGAVERDGRRRGRDHQGQRRFAVASRAGGDLPRARVGVPRARSWAGCSGARRSTNRTASARWCTTRPTSSPSSTRTPSRGTRARPRCGCSATRPTRSSGTKLSDLLHPDDKRPVIEAFASAYDQPGATIELHFRLRHRNGEYRHMEGTATNQLADRSVHGFVVNSRDVTEREQAAIELASARDRALERVEGEVAVPGVDEPRDPHTDERDHRPERAAARHRPRRRAARVQQRRAERRRRAARDHQRHPRLLEGRSGQARARDRRRRPGPPGGGRRSAARRRGEREVASSSSSTSPRSCRRPCAATPPGCVRSC